MDRTRPARPARVGAVVLGTIMATAAVGTPAMAADAPEPPETVREIVFHPAALELEVGEGRTVVVFTCSGGERGADQRPGTDDDDCEAGRPASLRFPPGITTRSRGKGGSRWRLVADEPGTPVITATVAGAEPRELPVFVAQPVPDDDRGAIGTRTRLSGDVDMDGAITDADVQLLDDLLGAAPGRVIAADDPTLPPEANLLGGPFVTDEDLSELEARERRARAIGRITRRARLDLTPSDIIPLNAGGVGLAATVIDASGRPRIEGTFPVNLVGSSRIYYDGPGGWGGSGEVPVTILYEQPSFIVFTVPVPGFGFVGHQQPDSDIARTVAFEAVTAGEELALPPPGRRLSMPIDVDRDSDLDWDDYAIMLGSLGMHAGDEGFPARGDVVADGVITFADIDAIVPALMLVGPGSVGGEAGSGDLDGDGDLDARDVRSALAHLGADRETGRAIIAAELPRDLGLSVRAAAVASPAAVDLDGDGEFWPADVAAMAVAAGVELGSLGPYYLGLEDARRVPIPTGSERLDLDGDGMLGPADMTALLAAVDDALGAVDPLDPATLQRFDLDDDGAVGIPDIVPLRLAIIEPADADA